MRQIQMIRTPNGPLALVRQTAEKLLAESVLSGTLDGDLHAADAATVKAAIMASAICDFCSTPGASHYFDVPDFSIGALPGNYGAGRSTGGWMACDACDNLIRTDKRAKLVDRAIETMAFPKFSRHAIEELLAKFWRGMDDRGAAAGAGAALADYIEDSFPPDMARLVETDRDKRIAGVVRMTGLTYVEVHELLRGKASRDVVAKLVAFEKQYGKVSDPRATIDRFVTGPRKPPPDIMPHWQRALDAKFQALASLSSLLKATDRTEVFTDAIDLNDQDAVRRITHAASARATLRDMGFNDDVTFLRMAQAYSFNAETVAAIREAARSIPRDAPLSSIETPNTGAGWFWFGDSMPVTSRIAAARTHALLWGWSDGITRLRELCLTQAVIDRLAPTDLERMRALSARTPYVSPFELAEVGSVLKRAGVSREEFDKMSNQEARSEPALSFSAYVLDEHAKLLVVAPDIPLPSTRWYWPLSLSFSDMVTFNAESWDKTYGPGTAFADDTNIIGKDKTLHCISELSLFFVMACLWFRQTIAVAPVLTKADGHVERHARKRYVREYQLQDPPTVQVIALRKSVRVPVDGAVPDRLAGAREYHCRWIVSGHPRLQACGPSRKDRKLIWIEAHVAGPDDQPLRTRTRVYAVIR